MKIEVSNGEIIDKFTILKIKVERVVNPEKIVNIKKELDILSPIASKIIDLQHPLVNDLKAVNSDLWVIEDEIRNLEKEADFGSKFIDLARQVYKKNDLRARIKKEINIITGSDLTEEKSYKEY